MKRLSLSLSLCVSGLLVSLALSGCSGFSNIETSGPVQQQVQMGGFSGSNFGGHAPVTQADVYLFQVGTNGYASAPTSLLTSVYDTQFGYPTSDHSAADGAPSGALSVKTDNSGAFYISNYSCTAGYPVYLAAVGGTTTSYTAFAIQSFDIAGATGSGPFGNRAPYTGGTATFNLAAGENAILYVGQTVSLSVGITGFTSPVTVTSTIVPTKTTAGSFTVTNTGTTRANGNYTYTGTGTPNGTPNASTINLATLGLCPSVGNFYTQGQGNISYVYMNEVSTMATALAFGGFGTGPFNIGIPSVASGDTADGAALALTGIKNAALNANQLYDITGTSLSTSNQGEGHIARQVTPGGNGTVPRNLLNTLGNILASCVDSVNAGGTGTYSANCTTLFTYATSDGVKATSLAAANSPNDIATAAFNLAHFPAGPPGTSSTNNTSGQSAYFMNQLYTLQGSQGPFQPSLGTQPNDFSVSIQYPQAAVAGGATANPFLTEAESVGIDADGSVWINTGGGGNDRVVKLNAQGVVQYESPDAGHQLGYLSIDPSGNVWTGGGFDQVAMTVYSGSGTSYTPVNYGGPTNNGFNGSTMWDPYITVTDSLGAAYAGAATANGANQWYMLKWQGNTNSGSTSYNLNSGTTPNGMPPGYVIAHAAVENLSSGGDIWFTTESGSAGNNFVVSRVSKTGSLASGFPVTNASGIGGTLATGLSAPEMPALDYGNYLWVANQNGGTGGSLMRITSSNGAVTTLGTATGAVPNQTINGPFGVTVDGLGKVWVANRSTGNSAYAGILEYDSTALATGTGSVVVSPSGDLQLAQNGVRMTPPLNVEVDPSGVLWITSYDGNTLTELLGPAAPAYTPRSTASGKNSIGTRP
jgi:hypothetical protein